jgi:hypothetical protein
MVSEKTHNQMNFNFLHESIIEKIEANNLELAKSQIDNAYPQPNNWLSRWRNNKKVYKKKGEFAYRVLLDSLDEDLNHDDKIFEKLDFEGDYVFEMAELSQFLLRIEGKQGLEKIERKISAFLISFFEKLSTYIQKNSNDYPNNSINGKTWIDGAVIREWSQVLANYFGKKQDLDAEIDMCYYKAKITLSIMGHYPEEVGPDMISIATKMEKKGYKNAVNYYRPVLSDFQEFLESMEEYVEEEEFEVEGREENILNSLIQAIEGLSRLEGFIDSDNLIQRSKSILEKK